MRPRCSNSEGVGDGIALNAPQPALGAELLETASTGESLAALFSSCSLISGVLGLRFLLKLGCLMRLRSLMVSVFKLMGRARPCNLRNNPQALHKTCPVSSRRQRGVVSVLQLRHTGVDMLDLVVMVTLVICVVGLVLGWMGLLMAGNRWISLMVALVTETRWRSWKIFAGKVGVPNLRDCLGWISPEINTQIRAQASNDRETEVRAFAGLRGRNTRENVFTQEPIVFRRACLLVRVCF